MVKGCFWGPYSKTIDAWMERAAKQELLKRLWKKDPSLWKSSPSEHGDIVERLGWLDAVDKMKPLLPDLKAFVEEALADGVEDVVLLGMGGSSLAPEVFQNVFGNKPGYPKLTVLDSTDPGRVRDVEASVNLSKTLFVVSSKSGGTVELVSFYKYFLEKMKTHHGASAGKRFIAVTDPGSPLEGTATRENFRRVFPGFPDVGGRFSALTYFGLVPAALIGVDVSKVLASAEAMAGRPEEALSLGVAMAVLAEEGRDKLTILAPPGFESFGDWAEQLVAESTGKEGVGVVPVVGEGLDSMEHYGEDRFFVAILPDTVRDDSWDTLVLRLKDAGHPVMVLRPSRHEDLGAEFFRWELATAVACSLLKVNAFDQPDVQSAKDKTKALLKRVEAGETLAFPKTDGPLEAFWENLKSGDYVALLAFLPDREPIRKALKALQTAVRRATKAAVTLGFGPRYLHSTGQLHKGGGDNGVFVVITAGYSEDLSVPGEKYSFAQLEMAQALGDFEALRAGGRRVTHVALADTSPASVSQAADRIQAALMASLADERVG